MCERCRTNKRLNFEKSFIAGFQLSFALASKAGWKPALQHKLSALLDSLGDPFFKLRHRKKFAPARFDFGPPFLKYGLVPGWRF